MTARPAPGVLGSRTRGGNHRLSIAIAIAIVAMVTLLGACTSASGPAASGRSGGGGTAASPPTAHHFSGNLTVGALFPPGVPVHTCTASVVGSPGRDLLITAAHCIAGTAAGYVFAPGYDHGIEPFGSWTVTGAYGAPGWIARRAPRDDFAFLVVAPHQVNGHPEQIQQVTGANQLGTAPVSGSQVTVPAYSLGRNDDPIACTTRVYYDAGYPAFNCSPYAAGTSGAPWLQHRGHGWSVVGVIGGLHQGGCHPWTSYSAAFGPATLRTASRAARGSDDSTFPPVGTDGCSPGL